MMQERSSSETWVISRTDEGFRVYSPARPTISYIVTGSPDSPNCTCQDFQLHEGDLNWRCQHILAVMAQLGRGRTGNDSYDREERLAIQSEGPAVRHEPSSNGGSQMLLKRSVSPDGRIDSLSVEFSCPVDQALVREIKAKAEKALQLQAEIVESFLERNKRHNGKDDGDESEGMEARLVNVGGLDGRWGRRLFLNIRSNGKTLKLFGTKAQLGEHLKAAGFPQQAGRVTEGITLDLPCRVLTKTSQDGRFQDVERILPIRTSSDEWGSRR